MRTVGRILRSESEARPSRSLNDLQSVALVGVIIIGVMLAVYGLQCLFTRLCGGRSTATCPDTLRSKCTRSSAYKRVLDSLPVVNYAPSASGSEACAICLADYEEGDSVRVLPRCKHFLHVECVDEWLFRSFKCPICRTAVADFHLKVDDRDVRVNDLSVCPPMASVNLSRSII